jgi:AcrR family transcriptional regulator
VDRVRQILDAAAEVFHEKGFHGSSVDELGVRAGLSGPALYRHFGGKDDILAALFNEAMDELIGATTNVFDDPAQDLERALRHHLQFTLDHRHLISVYQQEARSLVEPWKRYFDQRRLRYVTRWESLFARRFPALPEPEVAALAQACLGMIFSLAYWPTRVLSGIDPQLFVLGLLDRGFQSLT